MKKQIINNILPFLVILNVILLIGHQTGCSSSKLPIEERVDTLKTNTSETGYPIEVVFKKGTEHNHPLMAIWITDTNGKYIETLYIAKSIAKGVFDHGDKNQGKWLPGATRRPAALPVWSHNRGIQEKDGLYIPTTETPLPDAISGATPSGSFVLETKTSQEVPQIFNLYFEINQTWDWNENWTNNKYPDDEEYKTSCQPALVYKTIIDARKSPQSQSLELIGRSHHSGANGEIYHDLETISTAKAISKSIHVNY